MSRRTSAEIQGLLQSYWFKFKKRGCQTSRAALIDHYRYLVIKTRQRIVPSVPQKISQDDLEIEGSIALVRAVDSYDTERKVKFESFAISTIRGAMLEYLRREDWVPRSVRAKQKILRKAEEEIVFKRGAGHVTEAELAAHLGMEPDALRELYRDASTIQVIRLDEAQGDLEHDDVEPLVLRDAIRSHEPTPAEAAIKVDENGLMRRCVEWLPQPERTVVDLYYYGGLTLKEIAKKLERSESRAHQLHAQALGRLRGYFGREVAVD